MKNLRIVGLLVVLGVAMASWSLTCAAWQFDKVAAGVMPLDPRDFPRFTLVTLGTGGAYENPERRGPSTAVCLGQSILLVDAGRGIAESLRAAKIPTRQPETVLLTNLLPENTMGLDDLLLTGWLDGRSEPLRLVGPAGTRELAEALEASTRRGVAAQAEALGLDPAGARYEVLEIDDGWTEPRGDLDVRASALPGGPLPALAYRFDWRGRSAVVSGTGWAPDALVGFAQGASLLVHEAVFIPTPEIAEEIGLDMDPERLRGEAALHTSIEDVGDLATRSGVDTLVLVRLRPPPVYAIQLTRPIGQTFDGRIRIAADGDEFTP